jgi:diacylglycerol kinase family enzyme
MMAASVKDMASEEPERTGDTRTAVLINAQSGTVRSMGLEAARSLVEAELAKWKIRPELHILDGPEIDDAVRKMVRDPAVSAVVAGGGDGTIASVAGQLAGTDIALGILPLGTMNLMAKSLNMSQDLAQALAQLGNAGTRMIDVGRVENRIFLHHLALGIQPRMVRIREKLGYSSRMTKMLAGARAMLSVMLKPQSLRLKAEIDGRPVEMKSPALVISNNRYENSRWMKHSRLDEGLLGLYAVKPMSRLSFMKLAMDMLRGRWRENLNVQEDSAHHVRLEKRRRFGGKSRAILATLDGEVTLLNSPVEVRIEPRVLKVMVPRVQDGSMA